MLAIAGPDDLADLERYLAARSDTSMTMRANLRAVGLAWRGARYEGQYAIARAGDDGRVVGVAGHAWNGVVMVQADAEAGALAAFVVAHSGRPVDGLLGPRAQVDAARAALGLEARPTRVAEDQILMALALIELRVPPALAAGHVTVGAAGATERDTAIAWRAAYLVETGQHDALDSATPRATETIDAVLREGRLWIARAAGAPVAMAQISADLGDAVQIGGVYTPPTVRSRGHARAATAGALLDARRRGAQRAILFTPSPDAETAYRALGFDAIGRFGRVLFERAM